MRWAGALVRWLIGNIFYFASDGIKKVAKLFDRFEIAFQISHLRWAYLARELSLRYVVVMRLGLEDTDTGFYALAVIRHSILIWTKKVSLSLEELHTPNDSSRASYPGEAIRCYRAIIKLSTLSKIDMNTTKAHGIIFYQFELTPNKTKSFRSIGGVYESVITQKL